MMRDIVRFAYVSRAVAIIDTIDVFLSLKEFGGWGLGGRNKFSNCSENLFRPAQATAAKFLIEFSATEVGDLGFCETKTSRPPRHPRWLGQESRPRARRDQRHRACPEALRRHVARDVSTYADPG